MTEHAWVKVGADMYECSKCGCEIEGYGECIFACVPNRPKVEQTYRAVKEEKS